MNVGRLITLLERMPKKSLVVGTSNYGTTLSVQEEKAFAIIRFGGELEEITYFTGHSALRGSKRTTKEVFEELA